MMTPLQDPYGTLTGPLWFGFAWYLQFSKKTLACAVRTEQLFPAIHAMFLNYDFELPPRCVRCVTWALDVVPVVHRVLWVCCFF